MQIISSSALHELEVPIVNIQNSGFDLVLKTSDGKEILVEDGLTEMIVSKVSIPLVDGTSLDYKTIVKDMVTDAESMKLLDSHFIGDVYERARGEHDGTGVKESILAKLPSLEAAQQEEKSATDEEKLAALEAILAEMKKALAEAEDKAEKAEAEDAELTEKEEALKEQIEELSKALESVAEKGKDAVDEMKQELKVEEVEVNNNTSTLTSEYDIEPSSNNSTKSGISNITEEGEPKPEDSFTVNLDADSDSGAKGDFITNIAEPVFKGTGTAGTLVTFKINGGSYTAIVDANGEWKLPPIPSLPEGRYNYEGTDSLGRKVSGSIEIDTTNELTQELETDTGVDPTDGITNEARLVFLGTTDAGSTVVLKIGGKEYTTVADGDGNWKIDIGSSIKDGDYDYTVESTDVAGNKAEDSGTVVVDTVIDATARLDQENDSGFSDSDGITNENSGLTFVGLIEEFEEAYFEFNGVKYPVQRQDDGTWQVTVEGPLPDNDYDYKLVVKDKAGNEDSIEGSITVDTVIEDFDARLDEESDSGVSSDDSITNNTNPVFSGTGEVGAQIVLTIDGKEYKTTVGRDGKWQVTVTNELSDGEFDWKVEVTDVAGNSESKGGSIIIATSVDITVKLTTDSGADDSDGLTNITDNRFEGRTKVGSTVEVVIKDESGKVVLKQNVPVDENGNFVLNTGDLPQGNYNYSFVVKDVAGNTNKADGSFEIDTETFVEGSLDSESDKGHFDDDGVTKEQNPVFSGKGEAGSTVKVTINGKSYTTVVDKNGDWSLKVTDKLPEGDHDFTVNATDLAGNDAETVNGSITIDITDPTELIVSLDANSDSGEKNDWVTNSNDIVLNGSVEKGCKITIIIDGKKYEGVSVNEDGTWSFKIPTDLPENLDGYPIQIVAEDLAGNTSQVNKTLVVDRSTNISGGLDKDFDTGHSDSDGITNKANPVFSGVGEPNSDVVLTIDGVDYKGKTDARGNWKITVTDTLPDNSYDYIVTITDKADNTSSIDGVIVVDTVAPDYIEYVLVNDAGESKGDYITNKNIPHLTGKIEEGASLKITITGSDGFKKVYISPRDISINAKGEFEFKSPISLDDGSYNINFVVTDVAGNELKKDQSLEIDTKISVTAQLDPNSDSGEFDDDSITNQKQPSFIGTGDAGDKITLTINNKVYQTTVKPDGTWSITVGDELKDGVYDWTVVAKDVAGNDLRVSGKVEIDTHTFVEGGLDKDSDSNLIDNITNETTPWFSGTGEAGAKIKLEINGKTYTTTVDAAGGWSLQVKDSLPDDEYTYTITITDVAGNEKPLVGKIEIDTVNTVDSGLDISTDSGVQGDSKTNDTSPIISGTGEAGASITVKINNREYKAVVDSSGRWSVQIDESLSDGDYTYTVKSVDIAGNPTTDSGEITIDTKTQVSARLADGFDTGVSDSDGYTNKDSLDFVGTGEAGSEVTLRIGNDEYTALVDANGNWSISGLKPLSDGEYKWSVVSTDEAGNKAHDGGTVVIDTQDPEFNPVVLNNDSGHSSSDFVTNNPDLLISGKTEDNTIAITVKIAGKVYFSGQDFTVNEDGTWTFLIPDTLTDGNYKLEVFYEDRAGNKSKEDHVVVVDQVNAVSAELHPDTDSGDKGDDLTNFDKPKFRGTTDPFSKVTLTINGEEYVAVADKNGDFTIQISDALPDGEYVWTVTSEDPAGNKVEDTGEIEIDTKPPSLENIVLANDSNIDDDWITNNEQLELTGQLEAGAKLEIVIYKGSTRYTFSSPRDFEIDDQGNWQFTVPNSLEDGEWTLSFNATDKAGNPNSKIIKVTVDNEVEVDGRLNAESDSGESDSDGVTNEKQPHFSGTGEVGASITLKIGDKEFTTTVDGDGNWSIKVGSDLNDGTYKVSVSTKDIAGNVKTEDLTDLVIDTKDPSSSEVELKSDTGVIGDWLTYEASPTFKGKVEAGAKIEFTINGNVYTNDDMTIDADGNWELTITDSLDDGEYEWDILVTDKAGNSSSESGHVSIDTNIDLVGGLDDASNSGSKGDNLTNINDPFFSGKSDPNSKIKVTINGKEYETTADNAGNWRVQVTDELPDGEHEWTIEGEDAAGNATDITGKVDIDTAKPDGTIALANDTGSDKSDGITKEAKPIFSGQIEAGCSIKVTIDGVTYAEPVVNVDGEGNWSLILPSSLVDDKYDVTMVVTDPAGNTTTKTIKIEIDTSTHVTGRLDSSSDSGVESDDGITNNRKPQFSGTGEAGAEITLIIDGKTYKTVVSENGTWIVDVANSLSDGDYSYEIRAEDIAGNVESVKGDITIKGSTFVNARLDALSDSGESDSDNLTNEKRPTFSGATDANATLVLTINGVDYDVVADGNGDWSFTLPVDLGDATYKWSVTTTDIAGNTAKAGGQIVIDTITEITGELEADSNTGDKNDNLTKETQPWFGGNGEPNSHVTVEINGKKYTTTVDSDGKWRVQVTDDLPDATHKWTATIVDKAGNKKNASGEIEIDTGTHVKGVLDSTTDSGDFSNDGITSSKQPVFSGSGEVGADIVLIINGDRYTTVVGSNGKWSVPTDVDLADGDYDWVVEATDSAGNKASDGGTVVIDTSTTVTAVLDPASNSADTDDTLTNKPKPWFSGTGEKGATITLTIDGNTYTTTVGDDGTWRVQVKTVLQDDTYDWTVVSNDIAGNEDSASGTIEIDTHTSVSGGIDKGSDSGSFDNDKITNEERPWFSGKGEVGASISLVIDGREYITTVDESGNWRVQVDFRLSEDDHDYTITATDKAGNTKTIGDTITIDITTSVTAKLDINSDSGDKGDNLTNKTTPWFSGVGEEGSTITLTINGEKYTTTVGDDGTWRVQVTSPLNEDKSYDWTVDSVDIAGNVASKSGTVNIDTTTAVTAQLDPSSNSGSKSDTLTNFEKPTFSGTGEVGATITLTINHISYTTTVLDDGSWSITVKDLLPDGDYDWTVVSVDKAGNTDDADGRVSIDTVTDIDGGLDSASDSGTEVNCTNDKTPTFSGTGEVGATVTLVINKKSYTATVDEHGNWTITLPVELNDGEYEWTATIVDAADNREEIKGEIEIDTVIDIDGGLDSASDSGTSSSDGLTSEKLPTFIGEGEIDGEVILNINGKNYGTTVDKDGNWSVTVTDELPDGKYDWKATIVDGAGNSTFVDGKIEIDTTNVVTARLDQASDSGDLNDDGRTREKSPTFSGTGEAGATIVLTINNEDYTTKVGSDGSWSVDVSAELPDGDYVWKVVSTDKAGNEAKSGGTVVIDTVTSVSASLEAASDSGVKGDKVTNEKAPWFGGTGEAGATITLHIDGKDYTTVVGENGKWRVQVTDNLSDGDYNWTVTANDIAGNVKTDAGTIEIDTQTEVTARLSAKSDTGSSDSDGVTNSDSVFFNGKGEVGAKIVFEINGQEYKTTVDSDGNWEVEVGSLDGSGKSGVEYDWKVTSTDDSGNVDVDNGKITVDKTDPEKPTIKVNSSDDTGDKGDWITNKSDLNLHGTAEFGAKIVITVGGIKHEVVVGSDGTWSLDLSGIDEGTHDVTIVSTDAAGNSSSESKTLVVDKTNVVDGGIDSLSDKGTSSTDGITNVVRPDFSGNTDKNSDVILTITNSSGVEIVLTTQADTSGKWVILGTDLPSDFEDGDYTYEVESTDRAGNTVTSSGDFVIDTEINITLELDDLTNSNNKDDLITSHDKIRVSGRVDQGDKVEVKVFDKDGVLVEKITATVNDDGTWFADTKNSLDDGDYTFRATVSDTAGNSKTKNISIEVDTKDPENLTTELHSESDTGGSGNWITQDNTPRFIGTVEAGCTVELHINNKKYYAQVDSNGNWEALVGDELPDGKFSYKVIAKDTAGNTTELDGEITIDKTNKLDFDLTDGHDTGWSSTDGVTDQNKPIYIGKTDPNSTVTITMHTAGTAKSKITITADKNGNFTLELSDFFDTDYVPDGDYSFSVVSVDQAGNKADSDETITVDTIDPKNLTVELDDNSNSGSKDDWITNDNRPVFTGTVEVDCKVWVTINGSKQEVTVNSDGTWSFGVDQLPDGEYNWTVRAEDQAGNASVETGKIEIDTQDPTDVTGRLAASSDTGVSDSDGVTKNNNNLVFSGTTEPGTTVVIKILGETYSANVRSDGSWNVTVNKQWPDGEYEVQVIATDKAGNTTDNVRFNFEVDTVKPTITEAGLHPDDDHGTKSTDGITNIDNPRIIGRASSDVVRVYLKFEGESREIEGVINSDGTYSINLSDLADSEYRYVVYVEDRAGNTEKSSTKTLEIDTQISATVELDAASDSGTEGDWVTNDIQPSFKVKTEAQNLVKLEIKNAAGDIVFTQQVRAITSEVKFDVTQDLPDGVYTFTTTTTDVAGNRDVKKGSVEIKTDTVVTGGLDKASDTGVADDDMTNQRNPTFSGKADPNATVTIKVTGDFSGMHEERSFVVNADSSGNWTLRINDSLSEGDYTYKITSVDHADNESSQPVNGSISVDLTAPNLTGDLKTDTGRDSSDRHTAGIESGDKKGHLDFQGSSTSDDLWKVQIVINGKTYTVPVNSDGSWEYVIPDKLADGTYTYQIHAYDKAGNKTEVDGTVKLDTKVVTSLTLDTASDTGDKGDNLTNMKKPTLSGKGESGLEITATLTGHDIGTAIDLGQTTTNAEGNWQFNLANLINVDLTDGSYTINYSAEDAAGNTLDSTYTFYVDRTPPVLTVNDYNGKEVDSNRPLISGTTEANCRVVLKIDGENYTVTSNGSGNWRFEPSDMHMLPDGEIHYTVIAYDKAGNPTEKNDYFYINTGTTVEGGLSIEDDTGFYDTDGITQVKTPTFKGIGDANAEIKVTIRDSAGKPIMTLDTVVDRNGIWTVKVPDGTPLDDGSYTYIVEAKDKSDNTATTEPKDLVIDNSVIIESCRPWTGSYSGGRLVDGTWQIPTSSWFMNGKLKNNDANAKVTVSIGGKDYVGYTDEGGNFSIKIPLTDGTYNATVSVTDAAGNTTDTTMNIKVDTSTDEFSVINEDDVTGNSNHWIVDSSNPTFSGTQDADSAWQVSIRLYGLENYTYTFQLPKGTDKWSYTIPVGKEIADGSYSYDIIYWEDSGRYVYHKGSMVVDTVNELLGIEKMDKVYDDQGDWVGSKMTGFSEGKADISIYIDGVLFKTVKSSDGGAWSVELPFTNNGDYDIQIISTDVAKNECEIDEVLTLDFIENLTVDVPNGGEFNPKTTPLGGTGDKGIALTIKLTDEDGKVVTKYVSVQADGTWTVDLTGLADGNYNYEITGTTNWDSKKLNGDFEINASAPEIEDIELETDSGEQDDWITNVVRPTISGTVGTDAVEVTIEIDGVKYKSGVDFNLNADGTWRFTLPTDLSDGDYSFKITAKDNIGNESIHNGKVTIIGSDPEVEHVELVNDSGIKGDWITNNSSPSFSGKVTNTTSEMKITFNGVEYVSGKDFHLAPDGSWSLNIPSNLADGDYTFKIDIKDKAGNSNSFEKDLNVDTVPPTCDGGLSDKSDSGDGLTDDVRPIFSGTGEVGATIVVVISGVEYTTKVDKDGNWELTWGEDLAEGQHLFVYYAMDDAGNQSAPNYGLVNIDTTPPDVSLDVVQDVDGNTESNPEFNGTGEVGATVTITIDGQSHDVKVSQGGTWTFTWPTHLGDGSHTVDYTSTDAAGNVSSTESVDINVETQAPEGIAGYSMPMSTVESTHEDVEVTDSVVVFGGKVNAGDIINITVDDVSGEVIADAEGVWEAEIDIEDLGDYTYEINVTDSDNATETIQSGTISYVEATVSTEHDFVMSNNDNDDVTCMSSSPTFTGEADADSTVTLVIEGESYETTVSSDGKWVLEAPESINYTVTSYALTEVVGGESTLTEGNVILGEPIDNSGSLSPTDSDIGDTSFAMNDDYIGRDIEE